MCTTQKFTSADLLSGLRGAVSTKLLISALQQNLFTYLETTREVDEIAAHFGWHHQNCVKYLEILSHIGLVELSGDTAHNSPDSTRLLGDCSEQSIRALLLESHKWCMAPLEHLEDLLRDGPAPPNTFHNTAEVSVTEVVWETIVRCGASIAFENDGRRLAQVLASLPNSANFKRMLDLGGGHGANAIMAVKKLPGLKADILDFPGVLKIADEFVQKHGLTKRIGLVPADYMRDALPSGYDLVLASDTLNFTLPLRNTGMVIKKVYEALNAEGCFVSLHDAPLPPDEPRRPQANWPFECHVCELVSGQPMGIPASDFLAHEMVRAGFSQIYSRYMRLDSGIHRLDVARKSCPER
jgi:hypothetical protein